MLGVCWSKDELSAHIIGKAENNKNWVYKPQIERHPRKMGISPEKQFRAGRLPPRPKLLIYIDLNLAKLLKLQLKE